MKQLAMIAMVLSSVVTYGQENQEQKKTPEQVRQELQEFTIKLELDSIQQYVGFFSDSVSRFRKLAEERAAAYNELNEALTDGDSVLIEKAVSKISSKAYAVKLLAESQKRTSEELQRKIASAFSSDLITKARYLELRNTMRSGIAETDKELPEQYIKLAEKAKKAVPDYFAMLEGIDKARGDK